MINLEDHLPKRKFISKLKLKSQEISLGDTPKDVSPESIDLSSGDSNPLEIETETVDNTKASKMIKRISATEEVSEQR